MGGKKKNLGRPWKMSGSGKKGEQARGVSGVVEIGHSFLCTQRERETKRGTAKPCCGGRLWELLLRYPNILVFMFLDVWSNTMSQ